MKDRDWPVLAGVLFLAAVIMIGLALSVEKQIKNNNVKGMYKIEFETDNKAVTVWADIDGIIKKASVDEIDWKDQVVIRVGELREGSVMQMYGLFSDVIISEEYIVKKIGLEE